MSTRHVRLTIECPFTLRLPDGEYVCRLGKNEFSVILELVSQPAKGHASDISIVMTPATGEVVSEGAAVDIPGLGCRRTRASVQFAIRLPTKDSSEELEVRTKESCRRFLNAFVDSYRYIFRDSQAYPLSPAEFYSVRYGQAPRYMSRTEDESGHGKHQMGITFGDWPLELRANPPYPERDVRRFREFVGQNAQPPLVDILLLNAKGYLSGGEYRLSVIEAGAALDIAVEEVGRRLLVAEGKNRDSVLAELERQNTRTIVEKIVQPYLGWDFVGSEDWKTYDENLRPLRNAVVHDALEPSKEQTQDFVTTMEKIINQLRETIK